MVRQIGVFDVEDRLAGLSKKGDQLERLQAVVDFELFRPELERAVPRADRSKGGRPPFDHVLMFKVVILQTQNNLSDERTEFYLRDRLTWMRFLGLGPGDPVPDANTLWTFREALTRAGALDPLFSRFDQQLRAQGYLAMSGQLVDATIVSAPKQRNPDAEKQAIKEGRVPEGWQDKPAKLRQKDRDARWTVKATKAKPREGAMVDLAMPAFGYQNHVSADRRHRLIRKWPMPAPAWPGCSTPATPPLVSGSIPPIVREPTRSCYASACWSATSTAGSRRGARCPFGPPGRTQGSRRCALPSSTCSPSRSTGWACSCAPLAWPGRRPRSASPTGSTTCAACFGPNVRQPSPDPRGDHQSPT